MTAQKNIEQNDHDYVWELLPWYVSDGLSREEINEVTAHLRDCATCQREVVRCRELSATVKIDRPEEWTPSVSHFSKILDHVDAFEHKQRIAKGSPSWIAKWLPWFDVTPRPARFALALQGLFVIALATTLLIRGLFPVQPYTTLSDPSEATKISGQQVRLVFSDDITEKELRAVVLGVNGQFIAGPSSQGVYTVVLSSSNSHASALPQVLAELRANPNVRLAEAVYTTAE